MFRARRLATGRLGRASGSITTLALSAALALPAAAAPGDDAALAARSNAVLGLRASRIVRLADAVPGEPLLVEVALDGTPVTLDVAPWSVRAAGYRVLHDIGGGTLVEVAPGPVNTFRGAVAGRPGSFVAGGVVDGGLYAMIEMPDGARWWIEPVARRVEGARRGDHVVYRDADALPPDGRCGMNHANLVGAAAADREPDPIATGLIVCDETSITELACDTDWEYYQDWGSSTESRINSVINGVNVQYERDVDITHEISAIIVRSSPSDPYSSSNPGTLLDQFRDEWLQHQGGVPRDVAHLFTGRELSGSVIGIAWGIGEICTNGAYCLSQSDFSGNFQCVKDLTAHELGHLWGAFHCSCSGFTMNPSITCANQFSGGSISSISSHRNSRTCLEGGALPYCSATSASTSGEYIAQITIGSILNDSGSSGYASFACLSTDIEKGELTPLIIDLNNADADSITGVWVDWNEDYDFNDVGEEIVEDLAGPGPHVVLVAVPGSIDPHSARLRVRVQDGVLNPFMSPCGASQFGEVEDYSFVVVDLNPAPANDLCDGAIEVSTGSTAYSNLGAATDGPDEILDCVFDGDSQIASDVWFRYDATCTAVMTASICDADHDAELGVYDECPEQPHISIIGCSDDACGTGPVVSFVAFEGQSYWFRVGGFGGAQGIGTLELTPDCAPACPEDLDGDSAVGFGDLLQLLSVWGPCLGCPEDLDGDDAVGFGDLLQLLSVWGPC